MLTRLPLPAPRDGWLRIDVRTFSLKRSELYTRLGLSEGVTFPRVLGIEAVGIVEACPDGSVPLAQQVATLLGVMGRIFDAMAAMPSTSKCPVRR